MYHISSGNMFKAIVTKKRSRKRKITPRKRGRYWRLVLPGLLEFGIRPSRSDRRLEQLKATTLDALCLKQLHRGLDKWIVAWQTAPGTGLPHLDILLVYQKGVLNANTRYDYLGRHGNLTRYRTVNLAILNYGLKQDPCPLSNMPAAANFLLQDRVKTDTYAVLQQAMLANPFTWQPYKWLAEKGLNKAASATNFRKYVYLVRKHQTAYCNLLLSQTAAPPVLTRRLIEQTLTIEQLRVFNSTPYYAEIVEYLNQIPQWGCRRPHKTLNLYLWGPPNTGKTTLLNVIRQRTSTYPFGVNHWWPRFQTGSYSCITWNEFRLRVMPYNTLLQLLEGAPIDLQYKGGSTLKTCNPLIIMTSNLSPCQHLKGRFGYRQQLYEVSLQNLAARVRSFRISSQKPLFLIVNLIRRAWPIVNPNVSPSTTNGRAEVPKNVDRNANL